MINIPPQYLLARSVLLDALTALNPHLNNLILVGAQAVYLHTNPESVRVPAFTTDADLILNPHLLADHPEITEGLNREGFSRNPDNQNPGSWVGRDHVVVDIMVVRHQSRREKKKARRPDLGAHDDNAARIVDGLEGALIDNSIHTISSFDPDDDRRFDIRVAGPAALLTAKLIKISERASQANRRDRINSKDALDIFRILLDIPTNQLVSGFQKHRESPEACKSSQQGLLFLREHSLSNDAFLPTLAKEAGREDDRIPILFRELSHDLFESLGEY